VADGAGNIGAFTVTNGLGTAQYFGTNSTEASDVVGWIKAATSASTVLALRRERDAYGDMKVMVTRRDGKSGSGYPGLGILIYAEIVSTDSTDVVVGTNGVISAFISLASAPFTVLGTARHANGDSRKWPFNLTVRPATITLIQGATTAATVVVDTSFTGRTHALNAVGPVPFLENGSVDYSRVKFPFLGVIHALRFWPRRVPL
jgi:hypothetical protein